MMDQIQKNNAFFRQLLFLGILVTISVIIFKQLSFFLGSFLGAMVFYVVFRNSLFWLTEKLHWKRWLAATVLVFSLAIIIIILGAVVFEVIAGQVQTLNTSAIFKGINNVLAKANDIFDIHIVPSDIITKYTSQLTTVVTSILNTTYSFAINIFLMLVILYFMLLNARKLEKVITMYRPFKGQSWIMLKDETQKMIFSNAVGLPAVMIGQGLVAALIYWLFGLDNIVFWAFLTALCGLIPMIGTVIVSAPLGIYLMANGEIWQGVLLIACGLLVIANVDNLIRMVLLKKAADIHPLIVIFGVIMGIPLFGFWGIIFGPLLISGFLLLIRIYYHEYKLINPPGK